VAAARFNQNSRMSFFSPLCIKVGILLAIFSLPLACSGSGQHNGRNHKVSVSITPTSASLQTGQPEQFSVTVSGTSNTAVTWLVNATVGGNSTVGTVSSSGLYVAPANAPPTSITITAQSLYQSSASASAIVTVSPPPPVSLLISPNAVTVQTGQSQQFAATVSGTSANQVLWSVNGVTGGNTSTGIVSSTGKYTAPAAVPSVPIIVTAQSTYYPAASASAQVSVSAPTTHSVDLSWSPSTSTVAGYNVYRSTQANGSYLRINPAVITATAFTDLQVQSGNAYYYATTAVDANGFESGYSNVTQADIP